MSKTIKLKKGFNINLAGKAEQKILTTEQPVTFALKPTDFVGMNRPKVVVAQGDLVKAGSPLFFDKQFENINYCSPVSGEVVEVVRGAKRKLLEVRILADKINSYEEFKKSTSTGIKGISRDEAQKQMMASGVWPNILQRPYAIVANPSDKPKAIFISAFDSHPLAPNYNFIFKDQEKYFQVGIDVLSKFTNGKIHVNIDGQEEVFPIFTKVENVQLNKFYGKHPFGNVGVQIHHLSPINKGEIVWTVAPFGVIQIGKLFLEGVYDTSKTIAIAGSEVKNPQYYATFSGARLDKFLRDNLKREHVRVISGNILTGENIGKEGYLGFYDQLVTVIPEGDNSRFFLSEGWLASTSKLSFHKAFGLFSFLFPQKEHVLDTNVNGEDRAFVMTGAFEKVVPIDILPLYLIKAILAEDFEDMEALGIYEVAEEDLALCEFIDVSKHDIQSIIREGIDMIRLS